MGIDQLSDRIHIKKAPTIAIKHYIKQHQQNAREAMAQFNEVVANGVETMSSDFAHTIEHRLNFEL